MPIIPYRSVMIVSLLRIAFWSAIVIAFVFAVLPQPPAVPATDKMLHMAAFFTLAVLGSVAYPRLSSLRLAAWLIAFGGLIELVQMIPWLHRDSEALDWGADVVAACAGIALARLWRRAARSAS